MGTHVFLGRLPSTPHHTRLLRLFCVHRACPKNKNGGKSREEQGLRSEAQGCAKSCASPCRAAQGARHHDEAHTHQRIRPFDGAGGNDVYEPEKVLASHLARGVTQYLVKWAGYESKDNTWEPIENLAGCEDMIAEFTEREKTHMGRTGCAMWRTAPGVPRGLGGPGPGTGRVIWQLTGVCYLAVNWV